MQTNQQGFVIVGSDGKTEHEFPAGMDPKKAAEIVRRQETGVGQQPQQPPPQQPAQSPSIPAQIGDVMGRYGKQVAKNVTMPLRHPVDTAQAVVTAPYQVLKSHMDEAQRAYDSWQRGDRGEATLEALASVVPVIGPMLDQFVRRTASGEGPEVAGDITAMMSPAAAARLPGAIRAAGKVATTPESEALSFVQSRGVPVDVATQSGNGFLRNVQQAAEKASFLGGRVGTKAAEGVKSGLATLGDVLASKAGRGQPQTLLGAGEEAATTVRQRIKDLSKEADQAYEAIRQREQQGTVIGINVKTAKTKLKPVYDQLVRESQLAQPQGATRTALIALDRLMSGPDVAPMSVVDGALSEMKSALRSAGDSQPWSKGVGVMRGTIQALDKEVMDVARIHKLDDALTAGRKATIDKYNAIDVLDQIGAEPVAAVNKVLAQKDRGISQLRALRREAPEAVGEMGRAKLDELLGKAREGKHDTVLTEWLNMGDATKKELFAESLAKNPDYLANVTQLFRASKELQKSMNPSGTAGQALSAVHAANLGSALATGNLQQAVLSAIYEAGGGITAKALRSPRIARVLAQGVRVPVRTPAARAAYLSTVAKAFQAEGLPVPAFASTERPER